MSSHRPGQKGDTLLRPIDKGSLRPMAVNFNLSRPALARALAHLRTLRASIAQARDALMHFKDDRVDRDRLEPAARRVDDLMNTFTGSGRDAAQISRWLTEIHSGIEEVTNPKSAEALREARVDIAALLEVVSTATASAAGAIH